MKKIFNIILIISAFFITACETDADIEIPSQEPKYVLSSFINVNDDEQLFSLTLSDPIFDGVKYDNSSQVTNAIIKISDGTKTVKLYYNANLYSYVLSKDSMLIESDRTYTVNLSHDGKTINTNFRTVTNSPITNIDIKIDSIVEGDEFGSNLITYYAYTKWQDVAGEKNYYCLTFNGLVITPMGDTISDTYSDIYNNVYVSDEGFDGQMMNATVETYPGYFAEFNSGYVGFQISVSKVDEHYFKYFKSLQNYGGDDPFSEPSLIYSNINNGLGVIGSYKPYIFRK